MAVPCYCDRCGQPLTAALHARCAAARTLEPPRFCPDCGRRMTVQITPLSWWASCVAHGAVAGPAA